ncbi:hypothetical protein GCM10027418_30530 [Mariniluteicoccus endophyticus]
MLRPGQSKSGSEARQACRAYEGPRVEAGGVAGIFAPPRTPRSDAPVDRLLAMVGRG